MEHNISKVVWDFSQNIVKITLIWPWHLYLLTPSARSWTSRWPRSEPPAPWRARTWSRMTRSRGRRGARTPGAGCRRWAPSPSPGHNGVLIFDYTANKWVNTTPGQWCLCISNLTQSLFSGFRISLDYIVDCNCCRYYLLSQFVPYSKSWQLGILRVIKL